MERLLVVEDNAGLRERVPVLTPGSLCIVFHAVFEMGPHGCHIHAVEALARGQPAGLESPAALFAAARSRGQEELLDRTCLVAALVEARRLPADLRLCVKVHASSLAADDALSAGAERVEEPGPPEAGLTACIPLTLAGRVTGAIVIFRLLSHKVTLEPADREMFDLLAHQAGMALYCARQRAAPAAAGSGA